MDTGSALGRSICSFLTGLSVADAVQSLKAVNLVSKNKNTEVQLKCSLKN